MKKILTILFILIGVNLFSQTPQDSTVKKGTGSTTTKQLIKYKFCTTCPMLSYESGTLTFDTAYQSMVVYNNDADIALNVGQEFWVQVFNNSGSTIANGKIVYVTGADATYGLPTIALAKADSTVTGAALGFATHAIENNTKGYITTNGIINGLNTNSFTSGQVIYLSASSAGDFTATIPAAPFYQVRVGTIGKQNASTGTVIASISGLAQRTQRNQNAAMTNSSITGTTSETILANLVLPGNSVGANDAFTFNALLFSTGTAGSKTFRAYLGPNNNSLTGAVLIGTCQMTTTNLIAGFTRTVGNKNSQSTNNVFPAATSAATEFTIGSAARTATNINFANRQYLIITCQLQNSGDTGGVDWVYTVINQTN